MSIKPLLNPLSLDNKSLDLYCNSITTATGGTSILLHQNHNGLTGYMGNTPINGNLNIMLDQKQLIKEDGKYIQITGRCVIQITDINYSNFIISFNNPVPNSTIEDLYIVGGSVVPPTNLNGVITLSSVGVGFQNQISVRFDNSYGAVFPAAPTNLTLTYSIVMFLA